MYRKYLTKTVEHRFVENIPEIIEEGIIYITVIYGTAVHKCACGCGNEVVTPFSKSDWKLLFDGIVSLMPSIGNWNFDCKSHYWITDSRVIRAKAMSKLTARVSKSKKKVRKKKRGET